MLELDQLDPDSGRFGEHSDTEKPVAATWHKALKQLDLVAWMELCAKRVAKACRIYNDVLLPWKSKTMGVVET